MRDRRSFRRFRLLPLVLAALLAWAAVPGGALAAFSSPEDHAPSSSVYGQQAGRELPADGITVVEKTGAVDSLDDYDDEPARSIADPLEPWNRFWFGFNDIFYMYIAKPAHDAWKFVVPDMVRGGLSNFWHNALFPMRFVNNLLQLRFLEAGVEFGRFVVNSTGGFAGFADLTKGKKTVVPVHPEGEDFGQTLGRWGIPHGFYLVWPFIGPSSVRETFGWAGDYFAYPSYAVGYAWDAPWYAIDAIEAGLVFNDMDGILNTYVSLRDAAVDPYVMMREAYIRFRAVQVAR